MAASKTSAKTPAARKLSKADTSAAVDEFMTSLEHAHKPAIEALRQIICGADAAIGEGVKWNAPSFRTTEYFATTLLRDKNGVGIILHLGAKVRDIPSVPIEDPDKLLTWLAKDRALVSYTNLADVQAKAAALQTLLRQWLRFV